MTPIKSHIGGSTNRESRVDDMRMGMLQSIQYPAGGRTEFDYEANRYNYNGRRSDCGGLRIKQVRNISEDGCVKIKSYEYGNDGCGYIPVYLYREGKQNYFTENKTEVDIIATLRANGVFHPTDGGYSTDSRGAFNICMYNGEFPDRYFDYHSNIVYYDKVTEYMGIPTANTGKIDYFFDVKYLDYAGYEFDESNYSYSYNPVNNLCISPTDFWDNNKLYHKAIYNKKDGESYSLAKEYWYEYDKMNKGSVFDMPVFRYKNYMVMPSEFERETEICELRRTFEDLYNVFGYKIRQYTVGASRLVRQQELTYNENGVISAEKKTSFEPLYLLPIEETIVNSDKTTSVIRNKYPFHFTSQNIYKQMTNQNILSPLVETSKYDSNNKLLEKSIWNYSVINSDYYAPSSYSYQYKDNLPSSRLKYSYNSANKVDEIIKDNIENIVYLWGYGEYPIAEIKNSTLAEVKTAASQIGLNLETLVRSFSPDFGKLIALKSKLPNALFTTYTYKPLIGMTSSTAPDGVTTYYSYDSLGRLQEIYIIENGSKKSIQNCNYHYKNQ